MNNTNNALETLVQRDKQIKKANDKLKASINELDAELETTTNALSNHASNTNIHTSKEELIKFIVDHLESLDLGITKEVVSVLPTENISDNTLYFVPNEKGSRDEYFYINDKWELVGSTETNFTDYYTKLETNTLLEGKANSVHNHVVSDITDFPTIPTKVSELSNDSNFVTSTELHDYATKNDLNSKQDALSEEQLSNIDSIPDKANKSDLSTVATSGSYKDLLDKPVIPEGADLSDYYNKGETDNLLNSKANTSDLAVVAKSGNYNDLSNTPTIPTKVSDLTNDSGYITSVSWEDVTSKPELSQVAISGSYSDLSDTPTIPTRTSQLINDSGFLTSSSGVITSVSWSDITDKPNFSTVATSGSYKDLFNKPTIPKVYNKTLTIQKNGTNVATFTSNSNTDVTADITVPTKVSELSNDSGFITGISWDKVTNKPTLATVATSGSYTDLSNTPTIPTKVSQLENDMGFGTGGDTSDCVHKTGNEIIAGTKTFTDKIISNKELHYKDTQYDWTDTSLNTWCDAGHVAWHDKTGNRRMHELVGAKNGVWRKACYINENQYFSVDSNRNISYWGNANFNGLTIFTQDIIYLNNNIDLTVTPSSTLYSNFIFKDKNHQNVAFLQYAKRNTDPDVLGLYIYDKDKNLHGIQITSNNYLLPHGNNIYSLGSPNNKWKNVYATTFNGNSIEFPSDYYITTDANDNSLRIIRHGTNHGNNYKIIIQGDTGKIFAPNGFQGNLEGNANTATSATSATKASYLDNYSLPGGNKIYLDWSQQVKGYVGLKVDNTVMGGLITTKNIGSQSVSYATNSTQASYSNQLQAFTGDDFTGGNHFVKAIRNSSNWSTRLWMCYNGGAKQSNEISVAYADSAGSANSATYATTQATTDNSTRIATTAWVRTYVNSVVGSGSVGASISAYYSNATTLTATKSSGIGSGSFPAVYSDYINIAPTVGTIYTGSQLFSSFTPTASGTRSSHVYQTTASAKATFSGAFSPSAKYLCTTANAVKFRAYVSQGTISDIGTASVVDNSSAKSIFIRVQ